MQASKHSWNVCLTLTFCSQEQRSEVVIEIENENAANDSVTGCGSEKGTAGNLITVIMK